MCNPERERGLLARFFAGRLVRRSLGEGGMPALQSSIHRVKNVVLKRSEPVTDMQPVPTGAPNAVTRLRLTPLAIISIFCLIAYAWFFWKSLEPYWFKHWLTTDDALQQLYPFHKVKHPELFKDDLITKLMESYLSPIHYWLSYGVTYLTGNPIMTGHWVMAIQLALSIIFLFAAVNYCGGLVPACFSVIWLLHTRHVIQRTSGGLPRGWALVVFLAFLNFSFRGKHKAILATFFVGSLLHPPATFVCALSYGMWLSIGLISKRSRKARLRPFLNLLIATPFIALLAFSVVKMSPEIGTIATLETAKEMPEFHQPNGRFPYLPFTPPWLEMKMYAFQAFISRFYDPGQALRANIPWIVCVLVAALLIYSLWRNRELIPLPLVTFGLAALITYFASREFAFRLYVPNRHLQFPLGVFFIMTFSIGLWRAFHRSKSFSDSSLTNCGGSALALLALSLFVYIGSGNGLNGIANFNYPLNKRGYAFAWLRQNTPLESVVAGHPTHIDPLQLFAARQAYVTSETAHPFFDKYNLEMRRRLEISLRAHYARSLSELLAILEPEGIDYFVFERAKFYPEALSTATYNAPFDQLVRTLTSKASNEYAYRELPSQPDLLKYPFFVFQDRKSAVIDIAKLKQHLQSRHEKETGSA